MTTSPQLRALGEFLRARRGEASPEALPPYLVHGATRRRVPGLRREEVAQLVSVSTDYYTRLEQGRLTPSDRVFASLCRVFGLTAEQVAYAEDLLNRARGYVMVAPGREAAHDRLQLLLDQLTDVPGIVLGPRMDVLAWNNAACTLLTDFSRIPAAERNYVSLTFSFPAFRDLYEDWQSIARMCTGILRREAVENPEDPELAQLVGKLSIASKDFRRWWAEHRVAEQDFGSKIFVHPTAGRMKLNWDSFTYAGASRQQLVLWSADPGTPDAQALETLIASTSEG